MFSGTRWGEQSGEVVATSPDAASPDAASPDAASPDAASPDAVATLAYCSAGSEGSAAAELTQASLALAASVLASTVLRLGPGDVLLSTFPMLSVLGQTCGINATVAAGASVAIPPRFDPDTILRVIAEQRVTVLATFPALLPGLLREAQRGNTDLSSLRTILGSGGSTVPYRLHEPLEATFGCEILESYGPTESAALACATRPGGEHRPGSVGTAVDGVEVRVHTGGEHDAPPGVSGELLVRGPHTMLGYRGDQEATRLAMRNGWLHTGNEARMDADGYVYLLDGGWIGRARGPSAVRAGPLRRAWRRLRPEPVQEHATPDGA
jgi:long-chain acyl-CoA synthetase